MPGLPKNKKNWAIFDEENLHAKYTCCVKAKCFLFWN